MSNSNFADVQHDRTLRDVPYVDSCSSAGDVLRKAKIVAERRRKSYPVYRPNPVILSPLPTKKEQEKKREQSIGAEIVEHIKRERILVKNGFTGFQRTRINRLIVVVGKYFDVTSRHIKSRSRELWIVIPRHILMYLVRNTSYPKFSLPEIGKIFGKDHSSVCNAVDKINMVRSANKDFDDLMIYFERIAAVILGEKDGDTAGGNVAGQVASAGEGSCSGPENDSGSECAADTAFGDSSQIGRIAANAQSLALHAYAKCRKPGSGPQCVRA